jgi:NRPS condensation-like uncharacterized protein
MALDSTDPIKPWFLAAEDLGEYIGIRFGHLSSENAQPEWIYLRHTDFDGIGGLAEIFRQKGAKVDKLLQIKHPASSSWGAFLKALPKYAGPRRRVKWGFLPGQPRSTSKTEPPSAVAWHVFDEFETTQIRRVCRKGGVTVNSFLLKHLTKAIRPFLADQSSVVPWMIPVNLRGKVARSRDTENHSSYVGVKVKSYETVQDVHRNIYAALENGEHWANWHAYKSGCLLTRGLRRFLVAKERCMSQWNIGSFSNLGEWDAEKQITQSSCAGNWLFCPPVLRCQLLGVGCVTFQNRLSLTIQVHPELTTNSEVPKSWIQNWVKEIEMDLTSVLSEPMHLGHATL